MRKCTVYVTEVIENDRMEFRQCMQMVLKYLVAQITTHSVQLVFQRANGPLSLQFFRHLSVIISGLFLAIVCNLLLHVCDLPALETLTDLQGKIW